MRQDTQSEVELQRRRSSCFAGAEYTAASAMREGAKAAKTVKSTQYVTALREPETAAPIFDVTEG